MTVTDRNEPNLYPWEKLAPGGDCPKCTQPDAFKLSPFYDSDTDTLTWSCEVCAYTVHRPAADSEAGYVK